MSEKFVRRFKLGGGMSTATQAINGYHFVNGETVVHASDADFAKILRYFQRAYQAKEVTHGQREADESRPERAVPSVEVEVPESGRAPEGPSDDGGGADNAPPRPAKRKAKRNRPSRAKAPVAKKETPDGEGSKSGGEVDGKVEAVVSVNEDSEGS
jgi:hypothetical protein